MDLIFLCIMIVLSVFLLADTIVLIIQLVKLAKDKSAETKQRGNGQ